MFPTGTVVSRQASVLCYVLVDTTRGMLNNYPNHEISVLITSTILSVFTDRPALVG